MRFSVALPAVVGSPCWLSPRLPGPTCSVTMHDGLVSVNAKGRDDPPDPRGMGEGRPDQIRQRRPDRRRTDHAAADRRPGNAGARHSFAFGERLPGRATANHDFERVALRSRARDADAGGPAVRSNASFTPPPFSAAAAGIRTGRRGRPRERRAEQRRSRNAPPPAPPLSPATRSGLQHVSSPTAPQGGGAGAPAPHSADGARSVGNTRRGVHSGHHRSAAAAARTSNAARTGHRRADAGLSARPSAISQHPSYSAMASSTT